MKGCIYSFSKGFQSTNFWSQTKQTQMQPQGLPRRPLCKSPMAPSAGLSSSRPQHPAQFPGQSSAQKMCTMFPMAKLDLFVGPRFFQQPLSLSAFTSSFPLPCSVPATLASMLSLKSTLLPQGLCTYSAFTTHSLLPFRSLLEGPFTKLPLSLFPILFFFFAYSTYVFPTC